MWERPVSPAAPRPPPRSAGAVGGRGRCRRPSHPLRGAAALSRLNGYQRPRGANAEAKAAPSSSPAAFEAPEAAPAAPAPGPFPARSAALRQVFLPALLFLRRRSRPLRLPPAAGRSGLRSGSAGTGGGQRPPLQPGRAEPPPGEQHLPPGPDSYTTKKPTNETN